MGLKTVQRVTFSLPKVTVKKLEASVPKNKRSKFLAELIEKNLPGAKVVSLEEIENFWNGMAEKYPDKIKNKKTAVQLVREDRNSH